MTNTRDLANLGDILTDGDTGQVLTAVNAGDEPTWEYPPAQIPGWFYTFVDFQSNAGGRDFTTATNGTGAANGTSAPSTLAGSTGMGWLYTSLGTTATGRASFTGGTGSGALQFGLGRCLMRSRTRILQLSNATDTWTYRVGFIDNTAGETTDGAFFRYTDTVNDGKYQAVTRDNNVETAADTGVTVAINTTVLLEVRVDASVPEAKFYIDDALVATITTNIPSTTGRTTGWGMLAIRSAGTATLDPILHDYMMVWQKLART